MGGALAAAILPFPQAAVEQWYSRGVYARIQPVVTRCSSLVPFALLDVAAAVLLAGVLVAVARRWRRDRFRSVVSHALVPALLVTSAVYLWFLLMWGLNYRRVPLEEKLAYDRSRVSSPRAAEMASLTVDRLNALADGARTADIDRAGLAASLVAVEATLGSTSPVVTAQPKRSLLAWYFRRAAIDGMTDPFFLEIIVNPDLTPAERGFTLAHEWAHLAGYADESEANFIAWLACIRGAPAAQYSGWLAAYPYLAATLPQAERQALARRLSAPVVSDLAAIRDRLSRANPAVRRVARSAYDGYLRANRIEEGIANYGLVVRLMLGTSFDGGWTPALKGTGM